GRDPQDIVQPPFAETRFENALEFANARLIDAHAAITGRSAPQRTHHIHSPEQLPWLVVPHRRKKLTHAGERLRFIISTTHVRSRNFRLPCVERPGHEPAIVLPIAANYLSKPSDPLRLVSRQRISGLKNRDRI